MEQKPSILIVEDYDVFQGLLRNSLNSQDYSIKVASTYVDAKHLLEDNSFDVAIVDLTLSESDSSNVEGMRVIEEIRKTEFKPTSIIVVTADASAEMLKIAFTKYKVLDFILKDNFEVEEFIKIVKEGVQASWKALFLEGKTPMFISGDVTFENLTITREPVEQSADIFISYARSDINIVQVIYTTLQKRNHRPWMDVHSIKSGEDWFSAITRAINECEIFLAILSNNSVSRRGVIQKELKKALDKWEGMLPDDIYIIPIRLDDCPIPDLLKQIQVLDWDGGKGENKLFEAIRVGLARRKADG